MNTTPTVLPGHVEKNVIVLDEVIELPEGAKVMVIFTDDSTLKPSGLCGIWKDDRPVEAIIQAVIGSRSVGRDLPE